jgi:hypothetical protein
VQEIYYIEKSEPKGSKAKFLSKAVERFFSQESDILCIKTKNEFC